MKLPEYIVEYKQTTVRFKHVRAKNAIEAVKIAKKKLKEEPHSNFFVFSNFKAKKY